MPETSKRYYVNPTPVYNQFKTELVDYTVHAVCGYVMSLPIREFEGEPTPITFQIELWGVKGSDTPPRFDQLELLNTHSLKAPVQALIGLLYAPSRHQTLVAMLAEHNLVLIEPQPTPQTQYPQPTIIDEEP